jgi:hypothetical protein
MGNGTREAWDYSRVLQVRDSMLWVRDPIVGNGNPMLRVRDPIVGNRAKKNSADAHDDCATTGILWRLDSKPKPVWG